VLPRKIITRLKKGIGLNSFDKHLIGRKVFDLYIKRENTQY
jgi:hypothetical protein